MGGGSIQLARIFGIRVGVSPSWFFILFLMIYSLSGYFDSVLAGSRNTAYAVAVAGAVLFFASIVLHELGHAIVARRNGIGISGIDLWFFGGIAKMERDAESPGEDFRVAAAGPAGHAADRRALVRRRGLPVRDGRLLRHRDVRRQPGVARRGAARLAVRHQRGPLRLQPDPRLPAGRRPHRTRDRLEGHRATATAPRSCPGRVGQIFGYALIGLGVYVGFRGDTVDGIWFALLGVFLGQAARGAVVSSEVSERIEGVTVADLMDTDPFTLSKDTPALEAQESLSQRTASAFAPIVDEARRYLGYVRAERVDGAVQAGQPVLPVGELTDDEDALAAARCAARRAARRPGPRGHGRDRRGRARGPPRGRRDRWRGSARRSPPWPRSGPL